ncbi:hypothetical protein G9C98_007532 [Cotesia typhae]|uniref:HTH OST-type domain-containing protein n=1 Tax=Cotesia typhae TaxID=2053667 RepID=A0A8J5UW60_9HYME|nr:hypothetical protein G9C98_007532 [Cotesia typhae]
MTIDQEIQDLRSAVVSQLATRKQAYGIPLDAVVRDYHELNGEQIPYQRYGFTSLVEFLKTIPEIEVYQQGVIHYINFKGKDSFKHVTDLVARTQRKTNNNRSRSVGMRKTVPPGYRPPQDYNRPHESTSSSSSIIDPAVTTEILSVIKECPSGLFLSELLEKLYNRLRLNLSNNQIQEHLKMLEREVMTKNNMIYLRKSSPRDSFAQKSSRSQSVPPRKYNQTKYSTETNGNRYHNKYAKKNSDYNHSDKNNGNSNGQYSNANYHHICTETNYSKNVSSNNFKIAGMDSDEDLTNGFNDDLDNWPRFAESGFNGFHAVNGKNNDKSQSHGNSGKPGDIISDSREIKDTEKINHNKHDSSYNAYESKVRSSNYQYEFEAVKPKINTSGDDVTKAGSIDREVLFQKNKKFVVESLSQRTVLRLQKLLENNPNGIWCVDLPTLYEKEYKLSLEWEKSNCQRFSDFVSYLPHIFHKIGPYRRGDYKLFDARKPIPDDDDKVIKQTPTLASVYSSYNCQNYFDESIPRRLSRDVRRKLFPLDVINDEETIECIQVSEFAPFTDELGVKEFRTVEVQVVEAFHPSFFWVQLTRNKADFDDMMERLGSFYDENSSKYVIPQILMVEKLNVACKFYGTWHRGMIKSISPSLTSAKIHFYDFGTMKSYRSEELFFLKRSFGILPAQAIPCGLVGIQPKVHNGEDPEDLHIADFLLRHKLAAKSNTVRITTRNFFFKHALQSSAEWKKKYLNASVGNSRLARMNHHKSVKFVSSDNNKYRIHIDENAQKSSERLGKTMSPSMLREMAKSELKSKQVESPPSPVVLNYLPPPKVNLLSLGSSLDKVQLWFELNKELNKNTDDASSAELIGAKFEASKLEPIHNESKTVSKKSTQPIKLEDIFKTYPAQHASETLEQDHVSKISKPDCVSGSSNHSSLSKAPIEDHNRVKCEDVSNIIAVDDKADIPDCGTFSSPLGGHGRAEPIDWNDIKQLLKKNERETLQSQSSSDETSSGKKAPVLSQSGVSKLLAAFDDEDEDGKIPESGTFSSPLGGHGREEFLDWNVVRRQVQGTNDGNVSKLISVGKLSSSAKPMVGSNQPVGKSYLNDEAHRYFENFYQSCVAPKISKGNSILSWNSGDEIQHTGTITPMVRQTLNTINKKSGRVKVVVPVNVRRLIDGAPGFSSDSMSSGSQQSGWNSFPERSVLRSNNVDQKSDSDCRSSDSSKQVPTIHKLLKTRHLNSIKKSSENEISSDEKKKEDSEKVNESAELQPQQKTKVLIEELPSPKEKVLIEELPFPKKKVNSIYYASARISLCKKLNLQHRDSSSIDDGSLDSDDSYCGGVSTRKEVPSTDSSNDSKEVNNKNSEVNEKLTKSVNSKEEEKEKGANDEKICEILIEKLDSEESTKDRIDLILNEKNNENNDVNAPVVNKLEICVAKQPPKSMGVYNDLDPESDNSEFDYHLPLDFLANFFGVSLPNQKSIMNSSAGTDTDATFEDEKIKIEEINCNEEKASSSMSESSLDMSSARDNYVSPSSHVETDSESPRKDLKFFDNKKNLTKVSSQSESRKKFEKNYEAPKKEFDSADSDFQNSDREKIVRTPSLKLKCSILNEVKKSGLLESLKVVKSCNLSFNAEDFLDSYE